jgi:hypothetical protein
LICLFSWSPGTADKKTHQAAGVCDMTLKVMRVKRATKTELVTVFSIIFWVKIDKIVRIRCFVGDTRDVGMISGEGRVHPPRLK